MTAAETIRELAGRIVADPELRRRVASWAVAITAPAVAHMRGEHQERAEAVLAAVRVWLEGGHVDLVRYACQALGFNRGAWIASVGHLAFLDEAGDLRDALYQIAVAKQTPDARARVLDSLLAAVRAPTPGMRQ